MPMLAVLLAALAGFAVGQGWSAMPQSDGYDAQPAAIAPVEDWHGNVRRSHWGR
ncbi:hypothetical protein [Cribrihabitans marinus]|nr:hypothetical protein [Cribrihabitans marinus]